MCKTGYFRWDIWMADLSQFNLENHFVVIVSNFKNNTKSKSVNCCLITSKLRGIDSRVNINLLTSSQIACETILTINKGNLLYKFSKVEDVITQLEIEKALESQLQLSNQYINNDIDLLESYLLKGVQKLNNKSRLEKLRNDIYDLAVSGKHQETILACNKLIECIKSQKLIDSNIYLWHAYYHRAIMFSKLNQYQLSGSDLREALRYVGSLRGGLNNKYTYTLWGIAKAEENLNNIEQSISIYKSLSKYYKNLAKDHLRAAMLFNISKINKNARHVQKIINIVESMTFIEYETHMTKEVLISEMKQDLKNLLKQ